MKRTKNPRPAPTMPPHERGMRNGLLGGSFNPPHAAHRLISLMALRRLGLDQVWWLVTPGNPLKDNSKLPDGVSRREQAALMVDHPRIKVTLLEDAIGTRFTFDTLAWLRMRHPGIHFVWLMGADNLVGFHRWARWRDILNLMPMAVFDRPGSTLSATRAHAALAFGAFRWSEHRAKQLVLSKKPAWIFFHGRRSELSSTEIRNRQNNLIGKD
jgi:nicotinate-nucleotide adenylyltransferase